MKYFLRVKRHLTAIENKRERYKPVVVALKSPAQPIPVQRVMTETSPRNLLNQIDWYQKAVNVIQERES